MKSNKRIYTKYGDSGITNLLYGGRVSKSDLRCRGYGNIDEACSTIGLARALSEDNKVKSILKDLQHEMFVVGAELATDINKYDKFLIHFSPVTTQMVDRLEKEIDNLERCITLPRSFIIPGGSPASAAIDVARSIVRRAERDAVGIRDMDQLTNIEILRYLNRLSDLLFILARYQDRDLPIDQLKPSKDQS